MRALLFCMAFACANAAAQSAPPATFQAQSMRGLPALLARAVPRDPQVVAAQAALATTEARYKQARSRLFPNAALQATVSELRTQPFSLPATCCNSKSPVACP